MRLVSIQDMIDRARKAADNRNSARYSEAEIIRDLNTGVAELHDFLTGAFSADYYFTTQTYTMAVSTPSYVLPADFYKLAGVDVESGLSSGDFVPMRRANEEARAFSQSASVVPRYFLRGRYIVLTPPPSAARQFKVHYNPTAPKLIKTEFLAAAVTISSNQIALTDHGLRLNEPVRFTTASALPGGLAVSTTYYVIVVDANTIQVAASIDGSAIDLTSTGTGPHTILSLYDGVNGWEEYAVLDAAIKMLDEEESDSRPQQKRLAAMKDRLETMTNNRDTCEAFTVRDVTGAELDSETDMRGGMRWPPPA